MDATGQTLGERFLRSRGIFVDKNWYWIGVGALIGYMVLFNFLFILFLEWLDREFSGQRNLSQNVDFSLFEAMSLKRLLAANSALGKGQTTVSEEALQEKEANRTGANVELATRGSAATSDGQSVSPSAPSPTVFSLLLWSGI